MKSARVFGAVVGGCCALLLLAACATPSGEEATAAADRGRAFAERACSQCHAVGQEANARRTAPPFRDMPFDLNAIRYERRVAELTRGHVGMPPQEISDQDLRDLAAYIRVLKGSGGGAP